MRLISFILIVVSVCPLVEALPKPATRPAEAGLPKPLTHYMGREIAQTMHWTGARWLTREEREKEEDCTTMVKQLEVKKGQTIADLGAGNGFYTLKLARLVGEDGKVLAVEIQKEMLDMLKVRAEKEQVKNIEMILCTTADPKLPEGKVDMVLMVDVYHELSNPEEVLAGVKKSLKGKGQLVLVEFRAEDPEVPIKREHKMSKKQILAEMSANGFKLAREFDGLPWQHQMFFEAAGDKDTVGK